MFWLIFISTYKFKSIWRIEDIVYCRIIFHFLHKILKNEHRASWDLKNNVTRLFSFSQNVYFEFLHQTNFNFERIHIEVSTVVVNKKCWFLWILWELRLNRYHSRKRKKIIMAFSVKWLFLRYYIGNAEIFKKRKQRNQGCSLQVISKDKDTHFKLQSKIFFGTFSLSALLSVQKYRWFFSIHTMKWILNIIW